MGDLFEIVSKIPFGTPTLLNYAVQNFFFKKERKNQIRPLIHSKNELNLKKFKKKKLQVNWTCPSWLCARAHQPIRTQWDIFPNRVTCSHLCSIAEQPSGQQQEKALDPHTEEFDDEVGDANCPQDLPESQWLQSWTEEHKAGEGHGLN